MIVKFGFTFAGTKTHLGKLLQNLLEYFSYLVLPTCIAELSSQSIAIAITTLSLILLTTLLTREF